MMSYRALSGLHFVPVGQTVTADYYINEIQGKSLISAMNRKGKIGTVLQRKMLENMFGAIFQQDGAPAHKAKITQDWSGGRINKFWVKGTWPANSPDLSPESR